MQNIMNTIDLREQRASVISNIKEYVEILKIDAGEIFGRDQAITNFRNGAVDICRKIIADQPDIGRHEFLEKAIASGVNKATASTQFSRLKK